MKSAHILAIAVSIALFACNSTVKKTPGKDTTANTSGKADSLRSVTIDEPVNGNPSADSNQPKASNNAANPGDQKDTRLIFPHFVVKVHDFKVGDTYQVYDHDTSAAQLDMDTDHVWSITAKRDTLDLYGYSDDSFVNNLLEIIPDNKTDSFKISYSFNLSLTRAGDKNPVKWTGKTQRKTLKDSAGYFFSVPKKAYYTDFEKAFKKKLHLRDTLVTYTDEYGPEKETDDIYKGVPCVFNADGICLRIDRFAKGKLADVKYLIFSLDDGDD